jgi:uncharacterized protein
MRVIRLLGLLVALGLAVLGWTYWSAVADPVVREARVEIAGWPQGARPVRILFAADIHVQGPDMPPERLQRLVERMNALGPDLVLLGGDFIGDRQLATRYYSFPEAMAPLGALRAPLGVYAVLGNHEYWSDGPAAARALRDVGVTLLANEAVRAGPIALGGIDDEHTDHADPDRTVAAVRALGGAPVLFTHGPDPFPDLPADMPLLLAGHTHCGQIVLPFYGPLATASEYGDRYACGVVREGGRTLIVSAGLGASVLPFRLGAPPDLWLVEIGGVRPGAAR